MIILTKLNGVEFILNCDLIETVLENPDTTIRLTNGNLYIVKESMQEIISRSLEYRRKMFNNILQSDF
ncbi:MAG: flagellar FlbD family protein [Angelakisella sp.]|nr:flagellar FlbD family protein [Angelakisella sp.]